MHKYTNARKCSQIQTVHVLVSRFMNCFDMIFINLTKSFRWHGERERNEIENGKEMKKRKPNFILNLLNWIPCRTKCDAFAFRVELWKGNDCKRYEIEPLVNELRTIFNCLLQIYSSKEIRRKFIAFDSWAKYSWEINEGWRKRRSGMNQKEQNKFQWKEKKRNRKFINRKHCVSRLQKTQTIERSSGKMN